MVLRRKDPSLLIRRNRRKDQREVSLPSLKEKMARKDKPPPLELKMKHLTVIVDSMDIAPVKPTTRTSRLRERGIIIRESSP